MVVLAFLFGIFAADYTAVFIDVWNDALSGVQEFVSRQVSFWGYLIFDTNVFVDKYEVYVGNFEVVGTFSSLSEFDYQDSQYTIHSSQFGILFDDYFEFFSLGNGGIPVEVYGMGAYFVAELILFTALMFSAVRNGQRVPDIKQRFGE